MIPVRQPRRDRPLEVGENRVHRFRVRRRRSRQPSLHVARRDVWQTAVSFWVIQVSRDPLQGALGARPQLVGSEVAGLYRHLKSFSASHPQTTIHTRRTAISGITIIQPSLRSIVARNASLVAVSGSALMNGWNAFGKFSDEKNTPESTHIGTIAAFIKPDAPSMVWARD